MADMYLKIEGIEGDSEDAKHEKWIKIYGYSHQVRQEVSGAQGGQGAGQIDFEGLTVNKIIDPSTPDLHIFCCKGTHIKKIELECCYATGEKHTFMKYELENAYITSVNVKGGMTEGEKRPVEEVTFSFGKFKLEYTPTDKEGKAGTAIDRTWDLNKNDQG